VSRPITARTAAVLSQLMRGISTELVRARFGLTGNDLVAITRRHRALIASGSLEALAVRTDRGPEVLSRLSPGQPGTVSPRTVPPLPRPRAPVSFTPFTPWEEFERLRVDLGVRMVRVPEGALITNGSRAWRCAAEGTP
jgi:hypothetical protein